MKFTAIIMLAALAMPTTLSAQSIEPNALIPASQGYSEEHLQKMSLLGAQMAQEAGWKCDTVSAFSPFILSRGFTLNCNRYRYEYEIEDRGGNWEITLK